MEGSRHGFWIYRKTRNVLLDLRYGEILGGEEANRYEDKGANAPNNTAYDILAAIFPPGSIRKDDVLVDVGCGKGRVLNWWLSLGLRNKIIGIELDPIIAERTRRRLSSYSNVVIINGDAIENLPPDGTIYYLYNSFALPALRAFSDRFVTSLDGSREVAIYYFNFDRATLAVFEEDTRWEIIERRRVDRIQPHRRLAVIRPTSSD